MTIFSLSCDEFFRSNILTRLQYKHKLDDLTKGTENWAIFPLLTIKRVYFEKRKRPSTKNKIQKRKRRIHIGQIRSSGTGL